MTDVFNGALDTRGVSEPTLIAFPGGLARASGEARPDEKIPGNI